MAHRVSARLLAGVLAVALPAAAAADEPAGGSPAPARPERPPAPSQKPPPAVLVVPLGAGVLLPLVFPTTVPRARAAERRGPDGGAPAPEKKP